MKVAPAMPAVARLWIVEVPILAWLSMWNAIENPSIRFSNSGSIASGVTSRPVKPVPPVVMMTSIPGSAIHRLTMTRIASTSSIDDLARREMVTGRGEPLRQRSPGFVVRQRARVGNRQHRDVERDEFFRTSSMEDMTDSLSVDSRPCPERVAGLHRALLIAGHEPLLALRGGAVGEAIRHHPPGRLPLQRVVADRGRRRQRRIDVAGFEEARPLLGLAVDPDAGQAIRLQLDLDLQRIGLGLAAGLLLQPRHARQDAEQVLDVMPRFMGDDVGGGEFAGIARTAVKPGLDLAEESGVEKDLRSGGQ